MWKLTIEDDEGKQTSLPLAHDEYGLGRAKTNAIQLTDRNVSRNHAVLHKNAQGWFLKDLQSYNGTYVNGTRVVGEQLIANADVVQLGDYRMELVDDAAVAAAAAAAAAVAAASPQSPAKDVITAPQPVHQRPNRLVCVVGPTPGAEFPLDKQLYTIGRSEEATISINHTSVSRIHAELVAMDHGRFEVIDKGSANGIRINGVELRRGIIEAGDALELGDVRLRYVGAGKIFRAGADLSQQLHAAPTLPFETSVASVNAPPIPAPRGGMGKVIGLVAGVGLLGIIGLVAFTRPGSTAAGDASASASPAAASPGSGAQAADGAKVLADARASADAKDLEAAHAKLAQLPDGSPARDEPAFKQLEGMWADSLFARVDQTNDNAEKRALLQRIASTSSVDPDRRKGAADMITRINAIEPPPPTPTEPVTPGPRPFSTGAAAPTATAAAASTFTAPPPVVGGPPDEDLMRRQLEPKVWSGRASLQEIRMLKAICSHIGNKECRDRAGAMYAKKKAEEGGN